MRILMPLPARDFDPTESAVPWAVLTGAGHAVVFATPDGAPGVADDRMVTGRGLFIWRGLLRAGGEARRLYARMTASDAFRAPMTWADARAEVEGHARDADDGSHGTGGFDGIVLPGGHAPGMRGYLESTDLQAIVARFFRAEKPVGAICHGVVLAARSVDPETGRSVLHGRRTTALPRSMELSAWALTALWLGRYYRTYPQTVQAEVTAAAGGFDPGPPSLLRDTREKTGRGFVVRDGQYLSARWPGDAWRFSLAFAALIEGRALPDPTAAR